MAAERLTGQRIGDAGLDGWGLLSFYGLHRLHARIHTGDFSTGHRVAERIAAAAEERAHEVEIDLRPSRVDVRLCSPSVGGVSSVDVDLARRVSAIAADVGAELECRTVSQIELGLDTPDQDRLGPFWAAVYGGDYTDPGDCADVIDHGQAMPPIWFQRSGSEEPRQRFHPDIYIDPAQARPRIDAALAAGGTLVSDAAAPRFWVLADPDGNRVCLATWQGGRY
jgi:4a-hydroxytetrahydrobiopterin dehydratase